VEHLFDDVYRQLKKDMKLVGKVLKEEHGKLFLKFICWYLIKLANF